jgi:hypothetical protein
MSVFYSGNSHDDCLKNLPNSWDFIIMDDEELKHITTYKKLHLPLHQLN